MYCMRLDHIYNTSTLHSSDTYLSRKLHEPDLQTNYKAEWDKWTQIKCNSRKGTSVSGKLGQDDFKCMCLLGTENVHWLYMHMDSLLWSLKLGAWWYNECFAFDTVFFFFLKISSNGSPRVAATQNPISFVVMGFIYHQEMTQKHTDLHHRLRGINWSSDLTSIISWRAAYMLGEYNLFGFVCFPLHLVSEICQIFQGKFFTPLPLPLLDLVYSYWSTTVKLWFFNQSTKTLFQTYK